MKLEPADLAAMDDAQKLVILEALVVGVLADGKVTPQEVQRFDQIVGSLPWGLDAPVLKALITQTQQKVVAIKTPQLLNDLIASMAGRIPSAELRDKVLFTMCTVMGADGDVNNPEKTIIGMFVIAFNITSERVAAIKAALMGKPVEQPAEVGN